MVSHSATESGHASLRIRLLGRRAALDDVRAALAPHDLSLCVDDVESLLARPSRSDAADCLLAGPPVSTDADALARVCDAVPSPVVAVLPDDVPAARAAAFDAGVTDAFAPDDALPARVRWLAGSRDSARDAGSTRDADSPRDADASADADVPALADATLAGFDAFDDVVCRLDRRWRVTDLTAAAADLLGAPASLGGENLWAVRRDLLTSPVRDACWRAALSGEAAAVEASLGDRQFAVRAVPGAEGILLRFRDVTDRAAERQALDRYERIMETIDDGVYTLDENFRITGVNGAVTEMTGYAREELVGAHATLLADESVIAEAGAVIQEILDGSRESGRLEVTLGTKDGESIPAETYFSALRFGDDGYGSVGVVRDVTVRKRHERTLTALNRSTRELFRTETKPEVGRLVVETATEVLELDTVAVYLLAEDAGRLRPVAWAGSADPAPIGPDDGPRWRSFVEGTPVSLDAATGDGGGLALPIGEYGLLTVGPPADGGDDAELATLTDLLAANAETALARVERSTQLANRERTLARRNDQLTRLNRFHTLIRDVNRALVEAGSRDAIERAVCRRLADSPLLAFAWVGEYDAASGTLTPRAWAGEEGGYLDAFSSSGGDGGDADAPWSPVDADEPSLRTARDGESTVVDNVAAGLRQDDWRRRALSCSFLSVASVPLVYNDYSYGVLSVYATDPSAFDDATRTMFEELGETTANAINSAQAKETLLTESVVELDIRVPASNAPLRRMAAATGGTLRLEGCVPGSDGTSLLYLSLRDADRPAAALESVAPVERVVDVADRDGDLLVEVGVVGSTIPTSLVDYGAAIDDLVADGDAVDAVAALPRGADVRELVETLESAYPGAELLARRTRERPIETRNAFRSALEDDLTDRQLDALRTAYLSGYFEWPRERTGQDVASSLGIAQPTFARHLRIAERKLLSGLFGETLDG